MTDLFSIIQIIMKCQKEMKKIDVVLKDSTNCSGTIQDFSGKTLFFEDQAIDIHEIESVTEHREINLSPFLLSRALITTCSQENIDSVLVSFDDEKISFITAYGQETIELSKIARISCNGQEIVLQAKAVSNAAADIPNNVAECPSLPDEEPSNPENPYTPNAFENAIIRGDKLAVNNFISQDGQLSDFGYSDIEIERIKKCYQNVPWGTEPQKIASRFHLMQLNKHGLAKKYYEITLKESQKGSPEFLKALNSIYQYVVKDGDETYICFWRQYAQYLKENPAYSKRYIEISIKQKHILLSEFERILILGDKLSVKNFMDHEERLLALGYNNDEVERIQKAFKIANWDVAWYHTAARIYSMQLNRNGLAELYYEAALVISNPASDEYLKILNTLAMIKMKEDNDSYITFFQLYQKQLKKNTNFCIAYVNALIAAQNWVQLEKDMPMIKKQMSDKPAYLERIEHELNYYASMPPFVLEDIEPIYTKYRDEKTNEQEKNLIKKLPDRNAIKALMDLYFFQKEETAYFALADYALFIIKEDKISMQKLFSMLKSIQDDRILVQFLPKTPVFWCDNDLIRRYINVPKEPADKMTELQRQRLSKHIMTASNYKPLNAFEIAIVNRDLHEVQMFIKRPYLLEELGYSDDEICDMSALDIEEQISSDVYAMRRILAFQGNKDHTAERYLFEAFYDNKIDMCNRLFPLLLEEKRGDLILELFAFDPNLNHQMTSLQRFYYIALCYAEQDDILFYEKLKTEWMNFPENEILDRLLRIAIEKKDDLFIQRLKQQKNQPKANEFETALIEADSEGIRKFVINANLLVELGYTPEEIQKISKIFSLNVSNNGTKPGQIANRVYLYQKNKNNLAERLYWNAIDEDTPEDVLTDYKALFQIYMGQHNYQKVCSIYENHLHAEMQEKFNRTYASNYCIALYELNRFKEFMVYFENNIDKWENFSLTGNLLYICEVLNIHTYDDYIWENLKTSYCKPEVIVKYILFVIHHDSPALYTSQFTDLFNLFFMSFSTESLGEIASALKTKTMPVDKFTLPQAAILMAMTDTDNQSEFLSTWLKYMKNELDDNKEAEILLKLAVMFNETKEFFIERAIRLYTSLQDNETDSPWILTLEDFIHENLTNPTQRKKWCDIQESYLIKGLGTTHSLKNHLEDLQKRNISNTFWDIYLQYKKIGRDDVQAQALFDIVWMFYTRDLEGFTDRTRKEIINELIELSSDFLLDDARRKNMAELCFACGKNFEGQIFSKISQNSISQMDDKTTLQTIPYLMHLNKLLNDNEYVRFSSKLRGWSKYISLSEEEELTIERLRNTIKTAELWIEEEVNILAKAIFCDPTNVVYWKLFQTWNETNSNNNETITGGILFQLSSQDSKEMEYALNYAVSHNLKNIALELILKMLKSHMPNLNISAQKNIRLMIAKDWFKEMLFIEQIPTILQYIGINISLSDSVDYEWNSVCAASDLAINSGAYEIFLDTFSDYLSKECTKQCCVIIAAMILSNQKQFIQKAFDCLNNSYTDVPYQELVRDLYKISNKRELLAPEKMALECIQLDHGNALGVNQLLGFYCDMCIQDQKQCGLETVQILMRYTQNDPVLFEVAACFLKDEKNLDAQCQFYDYMYDYLEWIQSDNPIAYAVGQMICGENYLRIKGKRMRSFKKLMEERYSQYLDIARRYQEFCDCILVAFRGTEREDFSNILFSAIFMGNWTEVLEYQPFDGDLLKVLKNNIKTDRINVADDYYRSIIKSVALFILKHNDMEDVLNASSMIQLLWSNLGNVGCDYSYFSQALQSVNEDYIPELYKIWTLDIETLTVYKKFFGKFILEQEHCASYANIFIVFTNSKSGDIFGNIETQEYLKTLDKPYAIEICNSYEKLYIRPSGPTSLFAIKKNVIKDSDYEYNIFSDYLKRHTNDFYSQNNRYIRFQKKYELICDMYNIHSSREANSSRFALNTKRQIFSLRSLFYYYSVLSDHEDDEIFEGRKQAEFINAVTIALSDDTYMSNLNAFLAKFGKEEHLVLGVLIMAEQDQLDDAVSAAIEKINKRWRSYLCARLMTSYGTVGQNKEKCLLCKKILAEFPIEKCHWIKNYKHGKSIGKLNPALYLSDAPTSDIPEKEFAEIKTEQKHHEQDVQEIISRSGHILTNEEITSDMPIFIRDFLNGQYEDKELEKLKEQWNQTKDLIDNGNEMQEDKLNKLSIRIGIQLIIRDSSHINEKIMNEIFSLVKPYSIQDSYLISTLHNILQNYIVGYTNLDHLANSIYENRQAINHLCYEQSMDRKSRIAQDIEAATTLVEILSNIANDLSSAMGEETIKERLIIYKNELYVKTKRISKFRNTVYALGKMIQDKINRIHYVPNLMIAHLSQLYKDSSSDIYNWSEKWFEGAKNGTVRGIVLNRGGAPANKVQLNVIVNSETRRTYTIDQISPGQKIPFVVPYYASDVTDGKVSWSASSTYSDENNACSRTSHGYGEIDVEITDEEWDLSHVGREKFNTQTAAEGEEFCGRTNELLKLNNLYNVNIPPNRYPSLLVTGLRRAGKSSVIKHFKESLCLRDNLAPLFVDAQGIAGDIANAFFNLVFHELYKCYKNEMEGFVDFKTKWEKISKSQDWVGQLPTYFIELSELLGNKKIIFILDEMENVFYANRFKSAQSEEQFFGMIRALIQNYQSYVSFIFCGSDKLLTSCLEQKRESQMFQVLQKIYVGRMSIKDIRDMFEKYNSNYDIQFRDEAIDSIMHYTNGLIWYTKVLAYHILDRIIDQEHIVRQEIHASDVNSIVELLIRGDLGSELIDLLDNNFGSKRKAIIRAMAKATKNPNDSVNMDLIVTELAKLNYVDNETGEVLGMISEDEIEKNLNILEKMDFIEKDSHREKAYRFTTELYRLLMLHERKIDKFIVAVGGETYVF